MLSIQMEKIPNFKNWYHADPAKRKKEVPRLKGGAKRAFLQETTTSEWPITLLVACQERALSGAISNKLLVPTKTTVPRLLDAIAALSCYCAVYTQYLIRLLTAGALPERNDIGDLQLFLYAIDDDHVVVTLEKKWKRIADAAGFGNRVRLARRALAPPVGASEPRVAR
jgi:hypothetical protein